MSKTDKTAVIATVAPGWRTLAKSDGPLAAWEVLLGPWAGCQSEAGVGHEAARQQLPDPLNSWGTQGALGKEGSCQLEKRVKERDCCLLEA